jgi:DNA-binding response OmpR family regulator
MTDSSPKSVPEQAVQLSPARQVGVNCAKSPLGARGPLASANILVVDDEPSICEILKSGLADRGYHVDTASNSTEALRKIREVPYDLVLTDICMPELDGISLYQQLQRDPNFRAKFIFMTGKLNLKQPGMGLVPNTIPCILKPFQLEDVSQKIREVLQ